MILLIISIILTILLLLLILIINSKDSFGNDTKNVYISMTTIPERLKTIWWYNNLKRNMSFLKHNYIIIVNIPKYSLNGEKYIIPDNVIKLQKDNPDKLIINIVNKDEGPITKLLPTLRNDNIKDSDTIIICDDDFYYKPKVFELIEKGVNSFSDKISMMCKLPFHGYLGSGFKKKILKNILKFDYPKSCIKVDDEIIRFYINNNNIKYNTILYDDCKITDNIHFCSILTEESKNRPKWYELNKDNRIGHTLNCKNDLNKIYMKSD